MAVYSQKEAPNHKIRCCAKKQGKKASNPRPTVLETAALPAELFPYKSSHKSLRFVALTKAAGEGFEPSHTESESAVLPLHNPARSQACVIILSALPVVKNFFCLRASFRTPGASLFRRNYFAFFATSQRAVKAAASWIAISESILRFMSTPASLRPCINVE